MDTDAPTRGRPREFDEDEVLDRVMTLFWERGFDGASMSEIVDVAGLNKSSLYNAFGSKDDLFHLALDRYLAGRGEMLAQMTAGSGGLDDLVSMIEAMRSEVTGEMGTRGCLGINSSAELGNQSDWVADYSARYRAVMSDAFRRVLDRAAGLGEIDPTLVDVYVASAASMAMAAALTARGGATTAELNAHMDAFVALVGSWRRA